MQNRELVSNTFEGGLDLDTDSRLVKNNKLRESLNVDITKRGDSFVVTDIKGEEVLFDFEDYSGVDVYTLASRFVNFLVEPTQEERRAILVFYVRSDNKFIIKALYTDDSSSEIILEEDLTDVEYELLKDSTVDLDIIGKFGYDVVYFVDNRRQPRKIDCVTYTTNSNVMTLTFNSLVDGDGYKQVNLNLNSSSVPTDTHRCYVYAYKTGGSLFYNPVNPLTQTVKYVDVNYSGNNTIFFNIYPEDYADYTFQIVYHKENGIVYRNFIIGNPYQVQLSIGALSDFIIGIRSVDLTSETTQVASWEFLYSGNSFPVYMDTPTLELGVTNLYLEEIESPESIVPDGYYQRADQPNTYFRVVSGVATENETNNGNVTWHCYPSEIESDVRAAASLIEEGNIDRLDGVTIHVPSSIEIGGIVYIFVKTDANPNPGRIKTSSSNNYTFTLEYPDDLDPTSFYSPGESTIEVFIVNVFWTGSAYSVTAKATTSSLLSASIDVVTSIRVQDNGTGSIISPLEINITIPAGDPEASSTELYVVDPDDTLSFGPICVSEWAYLGAETITISNMCS